MLELLDSPAQARQWCENARNQNRRIGFVPTMGALHSGHLSLVDNAIEDNDICCASIFVNPLQFNNPEDLANYPSTLEQDLQQFEEAGCSMVFTGKLNQFFPGVNDLKDIQKLDPGPAAEGLEGTFRPGHLEGVVTIVDRLFRTAGTCNAYFGQKDFQQTLVVRDLAERLKKEDFNIGIQVCPTIRESSGLAMSSRNVRLSDSGRNSASQIYAALNKAKSAWQSGERQPIALETIIKDSLHGSDHGFPQIELEYAAIRDESSWTAETPQQITGRPRALIAAYVENIRLIDNLLYGRCQIVA